MSLNSESQLWQNQGEAATCAPIVQGVWKKKEKKKKEVEVKNSEKGLTPRGGYLQSMSSSVIFSHFLHFMMSVVCDLLVRRQT